MAKTGQKAHFKTGESKTGSILLPTKFVTAASANKKGQRFSNLVESYASKTTKINEQNNASVADNLVEGTQNEAYATRGNAVTDAHPLFNSETLNMNDDQVAKLKADLDTAQDNGNVLHEMAFSLRGDWLVENKLYDPKTHEIDQDKLKHAEQGIVKKLFDQGFPLPLGEGKDDVVWFGVIHQDTDHLNMHLWFAKKSEETRPEMLHSSGEPKGVINFKVKRAVEAQFRNELEDIGIQQTRAKLFGRVDTLRKNLKTDSMTQLRHEPRYRADLKSIYNVLPEDLRGRWKVGNTDVANTKATSRMAAANVKMTDLVNRLLNADLKDEYQAFRDEAKAVDDLMTKIHGNQNKGQELWSEARDKRLRKEIANAIYREFNTGFNPNITDSQFSENIKVENVKDDENYKRKLSQEKKTYGSGHNSGNKMTDAKSNSSMPAHGFLKGYKPSTATQLKRLSRNIIRESRQDAQATRAFLREKELEERQQNSDDFSASI